MMLDGKIAMEDVNNFIYETQKSSESIANKDLENTTKEYTKNYSYKNRNIWKFSRISVSNGINVEFIVSPKYNVQVYTDEGKEEFIKTIVENGELKVFIENKKYKDLNMKKLLVKIYAPTLDKITATSGAKIYSNEAIQNDNFSIVASSSAIINTQLKIKKQIQIEASSSADVKLQISADKIKADASTSANIIIMGNADLGNFDVSSSAKINGKKLILNSAQISASSSGDAFVDCIENLIIVASSSSRVYYKNRNLRNKHFSTSSSAEIKEFF